MKIKMLRTRKSKTHALTSGLRCRANVLELALVQTLLQIDFLKAVREDHAGGKKADRAQIDAEFGAFMQRQYNKMMGTLALEASKCTEFTEELKARISAAVKRRNFLAHRYWRESGTQFMTEAGRTKMIEGLLSDANTFEQLDKDIREATKPTRTKIGIREDVLDTRVERRRGELRKELKLT
jgi:hypothetical protein